MKQTFNEIKKYAYDNDTNCCTVIATAIAFDLPFKKVQQDFFNEGYRVRNQGFYFFRHIDKIAENYGFKCELLASDEIEVREIFNKGLTPKTIASYLDLSTYFIGVRQHVFTLKNGIVEDWTRNRSHRVAQICKVTPIKKVKSLNISKPKYDFSKY